jgi:hypothetical protein
MLHCFVPTADIAGPCLATWLSASLGNYSDLLVVVLSLETTLHRTASHYHLERTFGCPVTAHKWIV